MPLSHRAGSDGMLKSEKDGAIMLESAAMPGKAKEEENEKMDQGSVRSFGGVVSGLHRTGGLDVFDI